MAGLQQMIAIARTEFRFGFRRGGPIVAIIAIGLIVTVGTLYLASANMAGLSRNFAAKAGAQALAMVWPSFEWLALILLPFVSAQAIPLDRQFGVNEMLRSQPLTGGVYLIGKVVGTVSAVLLVGAVVLALHLLLHVALLGPPHMGLYLELTALSALPTLVWSSTMGVVTGAALRTRRAAMLAGALVGVVGSMIWGLSAGSAAAPGEWITVGVERMVYQAPSRSILGRYNLLPPWVMYAPTADAEAVQAIIATFLILIVIGVTARVWLWWKEAF